MKVILTNHVLDRAKLRKMDLDEIKMTITNPLKSFPTTTNDNQPARRFIKNCQHRRYHVIAVYTPEQNAWIAVSAWVRGEEDPKPILIQFLIDVWEGLKFLFGKKSQNDNRQKIKPSKPDDLPLQSLAQFPSGDPSSTPILPTDSYS